MRHDGLQKLSLIHISFTGDPISAAMSQRAAKDYIQQSNLRTMGFELSRASYNFKFGEYLVCLLYTSLQSEIERVKASISNRGKKIAELTERQTFIMNLLQTHGALRCV